MSNVRTITGNFFIVSAMALYTPNCSSSVGAVVRSRKRNSVRSRPIPSAPMCKASAASAIEPAFAVTSTRTPSCVTAGRAACSCAKRRYSNQRFCDCLARSNTSAAGFTAKVPSLPFKITGVFSSNASMASSTPTMAGKPSARARMAMCEVGPPSTIPKPSTRSGSKDAVSEGDNSRATITTGVLGMDSPFSLTPSMRRSTRLPTSRRSSARAASNGSFNEAIEAACSSIVTFQA